MKGRPPKSSKAKARDGNPGKRRIEREPEPRGTAPRPAWLSVGAIVVWEQYAPELTRLGLLTSVDADTFGQWCTLAAEFRVKSDTMAPGRMTRMESLGGRFGLDPGSRIRLAAVTPPSSEADEEQRFFGT